jgi:hypothetical protein
MENLLNHLKQKLEGIVTTGDNPVKVLKTVETDDGQLDGKASLQLPAAYYDITDMAYSQAGENIGLADTEVTIRVAFKKNDSTRWDLLKKITKALSGTHGTTFNNLMKESQKKVSFDDIFEYRLTFGCMLFDDSAVPEYTKLEEKLPLNMEFKITQPAKL